MSANSPLPPRRPAAPRGPVRLSLLLLLAAAPAQGGKPEGELAAELEAKSEEFAAQAPKELLERFAKGVDDVRALGLAESSIGVGDSAPDGDLIGARNERLSLSTLWEEGPIVVTFYRGGWCPYCNLQLKALERSLSQIENAGATLVAVAPETPDKSAETVAQNSLGYLVLSDPDNALARKFGLVFTLPESIRPIYEERIGLAEYNGNDKNELPLAATYVIDHHGVVRWAFRDADYKKRAEPADIVKAVKKLGKK